MSYHQLPPPHHYELTDGAPVVGWFTIDDPGSAEVVLAVYHDTEGTGHFRTTERSYRLRQFKMQTNPTSAPEVDNSPLPTGTRPGYRTDGPTGMDPAP